MKFKKKITTSTALFDDFTETNNLPVVTIEAIFNKVKEHKSLLLEQKSPKNIINNMNMFFENNNIDIKVELSPKTGQPTLEEQEKILFEKQIQEISEEPIMREFFKSFKNYSVEKIEKL